MKARLFFFCIVVVLSSSSTLASSVGKNGESKRRLRSKDTKEPKVIKKTKSPHGIKSTQPSIEEVDECPKSFFLNPNDTDRITFLRQFKPCGFYQKCNYLLHSWFGFNHTVFMGNETIGANVCYPGTGNSTYDLVDKGIYLVRFDTGLDRSTYNAYNEMGDWTLISDVRSDTATSWFDPFSDNFTTNIMPLEETCVETFVQILDDWGEVPNQTNSYSCIGKCGPSCIGKGTAPDCLKHDVCSYFKSYALEKSTEGFCRDFDCGDEAAQTVTNCELDDGSAVLCTQEAKAVLSPAARAYNQKKDCTLRTKWDRNQGMPWVRKPDGKYCTSDDDCISGNCSLLKWKCVS